MLIEALIEGGSQLWLGELERLPDLWHRRRRERGWLRQPNGDRGNDCQIIAATMTVNRAMKKIESAG